MIALGYVHPGTVTHAFMFSVLGLEKNFTVIPKISGPLIARARNEVVGRFLATDCSHLLFVDTDIEFGPDVPDRLLEHGVPVVSALYRGLDNGKRFIVAERTDQHGLSKRASGLKARTGLHRVDGVGMGCVLIRRDVLETLPRNALSPFAEEWIRSEDEVDGGYIYQAGGEDIIFCRRAAEAGFDIWLDTDTIVKHHKTIAL